MSHESRSTHTPDRTAQRGVLSALRWIAPSLIAAVVAASLVALLSATQPRATAQARTAGEAGRIAVVDLNRILGMLDEQQARADQLDALRTDQRERLDALANELRGYADELDVLPEGAERRRTAEEAARLRVRIETENRFAQMLMEDRTAMMLADLFNKIEASVTEYADREGFALVMSSDKSAKLPEQFNYQQADMFFSSRRVLYASDTIDISEEVAAMMNNTYRMRNDNQ